MLALAHLAVAISALSRYAAACIINYGGASRGISLAASSDAMASAREERWHRIAGSGKRSASREEGLCSMLLANTSCPNIATCSGHIRRGGASAMLILSLTLANACSRAHSSSSGNHGGKECLTGASSSSRPARCTSYTNDSANASTAWQLPCSCWPLAATSASQHALGSPVASWHNLLLPQLNSASAHFATTYLYISYLPQSLALMLMPSVQKQEACSFHHLAAGSFEKLPAIGIPTLKLCWRACRGGSHAGASGISDSLGLSCGLRGRTEDDPLAPSTSATAAPRRAGGACASAALGRLGGAHGAGSAPHRFPPRRGASCSEGRLYAIAAARLSSAYLATPVRRGIERESWRERISSQPPVRGGRVISTCRRRLLRGGLLGSVYLGW